MTGQYPQQGEGGEGGEGGQEYLASVSDLMAGLIFVFIITLAVFALRLEQSRATQQEKIDQWEGMDKTRRKILVDLATRMEKLGIKVEIDTKQGILRLSDEGIFFPSGKAVPDLDYMKNVGKLAAVLSEVIPCFAERYVRPCEGPAPPELPGWCLDRVQGDSGYQCDRSTSSWRVETLLIEGHTDSVPIRNGKFRDNLELSAARAAEILRMVRICEPTLDELYNRDGNPLLSVSGYADTRPVNETDLESAENRRIDLRFMMEPGPELLATESGEEEPAALEDTRIQYSR